MRSSADGDDYLMRPIGTVRGGRSEPTDDDWATVTSRIELEADQLEQSATTGLDAFSHVDVVYVFDRVDPSQVCTGERHPRGRTDWPSVGILAQRAKDRPNRIGVTTCELVGVDGYVLDVRGLDADRWHAGARRQTAHVRIRSEGTGPRAGLGHRADGRLLVRDELPQSAHAEANWGSHGAVAARSSSVMATKLLVGQLTGHRVGRAWPRSPASGRR